MSNFAPSAMAGMEDGLPGQFSLITGKSATVRRREEKKEKNGLLNIIVNYE